MRMINFAPKTESERYDALLKKYNELSDGFDRLFEENGSLHDENRELCEKFDNLICEYDDLVDKYECLQQQCNEQKRNLNTSTFIIQMLKASLERKNQIIEELKKSVETF